MRETFIKILIFLSFLTEKCLLEANVGLEDRLLSIESDLKSTKQVLSQLLNRVNSLTTNEGDKTLEMKSEKLLTQQEKNISKKVSEALQSFEKQVESIKNEVQNKV